VSATDARARRHILLLCADAEAGQRVAEILVAHNCTVASAPNVDDALYRLITEAPELMVVDNSLDDAGRAALNERLGPQLVHDRVPLLWLGDGAALAIDGALTHVSLAKPFSPDDLVEGVATTQWLMPAKSGRARKETSELRMPGFEEPSDVGAPTDVPDLDARRGRRRTVSYIGSAPPPPTRNPSGRQNGGREKAPSDGPKVVVGVTHTPGSRRGKRPTSVIVNADTMAFPDGLSEQLRTPSPRKPKMMSERRKSNPASRQGMSARRQAALLETPRRRGSARYDSRGFLRSGIMVNARYKIVKPLGVGGLARVYHVRDTRDGCESALKILRHASDDVTRRRFRRELDICRQLVHPNIVRTLEFGEWAGRLYYTMELLDGMDLEQRVGHTDRAKPLDVPEALALFEQACAGLSVAHDGGVIHRDIKPANLVVNGDGTLKITDFGAAFSNRPEHATQSIHEHIVGTPAYLAPERLHADPRLSPQTDIYSLGASMYRCLTGKLPYDRETLTALFAAIAHTEPPRPRELMPSIPEKIERIILRAMARDPAQRHIDCRELGAEIGLAAALITA